MRAIKGGNSFNVATMAIQYEPGHALITNRDYPDIADDYTENCSRRCLATIFPEPTAVTTGWRPNTSACKKIRRPIGERYHAAWTDRIKASREEGPEKGSKRMVQKNSEALRF